jgi:single-stranded DNA-binding protein
MIDALINGRLASKPMSRVSKNNKQFVTVSVKTPASDGNSLYVSVIAFDEKVCTALLALDEGDAVYLSGELQPKVWQPKDGNAKPAVDIIAHAALTAYHVTRKRQAIQSLNEDS